MSIEDAMTRGVVTALESEDAEVKRSARRGNRNNMSMIYSQNQNDDKKVDRPLILNRGDEIRW